MGRLALLLIVLVAAGLRFGALDHGLALSDSEHTILHNNADERGMAQAVERNFLRGDFDPGDFLNRGPGTFFLFGALDAAVLWMRSLLGAGSFTAQVDALTQNPSLLHLLHRIFAALASLVTVWVIARATARAFGARAGAFAGMIAAVAYLPVREAHFGTVDSIWGLGTACAIYFAGEAARTGSRRAFVLGGVAVGVTGAVRYFGVFCVALFVAAEFAAPRRRASGGRTARLVGFAVAVATAFALFAPNALYAPREFLDRVLWSSRRFGIEPDAGALLSLCGFHLRQSLAVGLGESAFLLAVVGAVIATRRRAFVHVAFALLLLPTFFIVSYAPVRFGIAPIVALVPLAALAIDAAWTRYGRGAGVGLLVLAVLPSAVRSTALVDVLGQPDTRVLMREVMDEAGVDVTNAVGIGHYGLPRRHHVHGPLFVDLVESALQGSATLDDLLAGVIADPPRFLIRDLCSGIPDALVWEPLEDLVRTRYHLVFAVEGRRTPNEPPLPDPIGGSPQFFVPYDRPWTMVQPGPAIELYERIDP